MGNPAQHRARKRFGQHFLTDTRIIERIVDAIQPEPGQSIIEIGPGQGALTFPLLQRCKQLTAVELDRDLIPLLQAQAGRYGELKLINQDILKYNLSSVDLSPPLRVVGNLPYNISTPLMFHLLEYSELIRDMHFMLQKEVANRISAQPNNKHYGKLSVMMQYHCRCDQLFDIAPGCFTPPPKVDSSIIRLIPHTASPVTVNDVSLLEQVVQSAFNQRRKTIANSLKNWIDSSGLENLGIDSRARAENLTLDDFARITQSINGG
jgi:16S rRNA (adenine1518-N6/adenine1519-N6)-dimethyltransferase